MQHALLALAISPSGTSHGGSVLIPVLNPVGHQSTNCTERLFLTVAIVVLMSEGVTSSMFVCRDLFEEGAKIHIYDPQVTREAMWGEMEYTCKIGPKITPGLDDAITTETDVYTTCDGAHALATLTEWDEFKTLDFEKIYQSMAKPAFVFDGRNILDHDKLREIGFEVHAIGKPDPNKFSDL